MVAADNSCKRVLLVDDHPILRLGLRHVIESQEDLAICGETDAERDARSVIQELLPDAVVTDISLGRGDGIELIRDIRAHHPKLPVLVFSSQDETIYAERVLATGANGYLMKKSGAATFLVALRRVLAGGIFVSEAVSNGMIQKSASNQGFAIDRLSNREVQILHMIGNGMSTRETALRLKLSIKTVESHRQRIKRKLELNSATQLMQCAINWFDHVNREPLGPGRWLAEPKGASP